MVRSTTEPSTGPPVPEVLGQSPDGRFTYLAIYENESRINGELLVDDGEQVMPALRDPRDRFDDMQELNFGPDDLITWTSHDGNYGSEVFIARVDEDGRIVDAHQLPQPERSVWGGGVFDEFGVLRSPTSDDHITHVHATATDPFFVVSADPRLDVDTDSPLVAVIESEGHWALDEPGSWYRGDSLGVEPACGASTIYADDPDGYRRVLDASIELDRVVDIDASSTTASVGGDVVGAARAVVISVECPEEYEGLRLHSGVEYVGYGDGGPRREYPLLVESLDLEPVREVRSVVARVVDDGITSLESIEIDIEYLSGETELLVIPRG